MSSHSILLNTGQALFVGYDYSKIFIWENRYTTASHTNSGYTTETLLAGTAMGRIASSGKLVPMTSGASDGSQIPVGILVRDYSIAAGVTIDLGICISGDVAQEKILLQTPDTLNTVVASQIILDRIRSYTTINPKPTTENTEFDNY